MKGATTPATRFGYCRIRQFPPGCGAKSPRKLYRVVTQGVLAAWICAACYRKLAGTSPP